MKLITMTLAGLAIAGLGLAAITRERLSTRAARAEANSPPSGQFVTLADGSKLHLWVSGTGPDLVLIHGANGNLRDFTLSLAPELARRYRVIAVDRPGLGYSDPLASGDASLTNQARRIREAVAQIGADQPIVVGQSYGGSVAMAWAADRAPAALVLISAPTLPWPGQLDPWYRVTSHRFGREVILPVAAAFVSDGYLRASLDGIFAPDPVPAGYGDHIGLDLAVRAASLATTVAQVNALRAQLVDMRESYPKLSLPVELVHGDADTIVPLAIHSRPLSQIIPGAHLTVIPQGGHMPHHAHAAEVIAAIDRAAARAGLQPGP